MRMRKKPNLVPRMEKCEAVNIKIPAEYSGKWRSLKPDCSTLRLEIGCGKGRFTTETAASLPDTLLVAVERVPDAMVIAMERTMDIGLSNIRFIDADALTLTEMFEQGECDVIYINFCDPWPKSRDAKHRLTAPSFLRIYEQLLSQHGEIHFKTDNAPLFEWSLEQFIAEGWALSEVTRDLHSDGICGIMTDYEEKFHNEGVKINRLVASKTEQTKTLAEPLERLRNASLSDARSRLEGAMEEDK